MTVFTKIDTILTDVYGNSIATEDFDGDNDLDLLFFEYDDNSNPVSKIYTNNGTGNFSKGTETNFDNVAPGLITIEDFDGDDDLDLLVVDLLVFEYNKPESSLIKIYNNDGAGNFSEKTDVNFTDIYFSYLTAGDFDSDGDEDLLFTEYDNNENSIIRIYNNDGTGSFDKSSKTNVVEVFEYRRITIEDFDGDGDLDLLFSGYDNRFNPISAIYTNDGTGSFSENTETNLPQLDWYSTGDIDADGDLDLLITEYDNQFNPISVIYTNNGTGSFSTDVDSSLPDFGYGRPIVEDFDGDGVLDLLVNRSDDINNTSFEVYRNDTVKYLGNDTLVGTTADDNLNSGAGDDVIYAREGNDVLIGGDGDDRIHGQSGNDVIEGGAGNDTLFGGNQFDRLNGGDGNDYLDGFKGITVYTGGSGSDRFVFNDDTYTDWVRDFELGIDKIELSDGITFARLEITGNVNSFIAVDGDRIGVLLDVNPNDLDTSNFIKL